MITNLKISYARIPFIPTFQHPTLPLLQPSSYRASMRENIIHNRILEYTAEYWVWEANADRVKNDFKKRGMDLGVT